MLDNRVVEIYTVFGAWNQRDSNKTRGTKIIAPFHWPKLKYHFITKNIIELDYFAVVSPGLLRPGLLQFPGLLPFFECKK